MPGIHPIASISAERSDVIQNGPQNRILQLPADHDTLWGQQLDFPVDKRLIPSCIFSRPLLVTGMKAAAFVQIQIGSVRQTGGIVPDETGLQLAETVLAQIHSALPSFTFIDTLPQSAPACLSPFFAGAPGPGRSHGAHSS